MSIWYTYEDPQTVRLLTGGTTLLPLPESVTPSVTIIPHTAREEYILLMQNVHDQLAKGRLSEALETLKRISGLPQANSTEFRSLRALYTGWALENLHYYAQAMGEYFIALDHDVTAPPAFACLGDVYRQVNLLDSAMYAHSMAMRLQPNYAPYLTKLAYDHYIQDNYDDCAELCVHALAGDGRNDGAQYFLALVQARTGNLDAAAGQLSILVARSPRLTAALYYQAVVATEQENLDLALVILERLLSLEEHAVQRDFILLEMSRVYERMGNLPAAIETCRGALTNPLARQRLAYLRGDRGEKF